jgi:hypothetical protein
MSKEAHEPNGADPARSGARASRSRWIVAGVALVLVAVALGLTQPWKKFVNVTVDEAAPPTAATAPVTSTAPTTAPAGAASGETIPSTAPAPTAPTPVGGAFVSHAHGTTGTVRVLATEGGATVVRFEDLATDNGPDLKVYLSANPADSGEIGSGALSLGDLKGNRGNQNYEVPADTDLSSFRSVVIWCERFTVAFGAAPLT